MPDTLDKRAQVTLFLFFHHAYQVYLTHLVFLVAHIARNLSASVRPIGGLLKNQCSW